MSSKIIISLAVVFGLTLFVAAYDPKSAVGPCILGRCPPGHVCSNDECYPKMKDYVDVDAKGTNAIGPCVNGFCPSGYQCLGNKCYKGKFPQNHHFQVRKPFQDKTNDQFVKQLDHALADFALQDTLATNLNKNATEFTKS